MSFHRTPKDLAYFRAGAHGDHHHRLHLIRQELVAQQRVNPLLVRDEQPPLLADALLYAHKVNLVALHRIFNLKRMKQPSEPVFHELDW